MSDEGPIFIEMRKKCGEDVNRNLKVFLFFSRNQN